MDSFICLDKNYSTTRLLTKEKPVLEQKPEYKLESKLFLSSNADRKAEGGFRTKGYYKKSYENKPLICVVTVVFNGEEHLEQTIESVLNQSYDNVEYIIIDGGSTDGTLDIIKKYEDAIDYWISEPDRGIYDAMNKGISLASGEFVGFLNADDWYNIDTLSLVSKSIKISTPGYICGIVDIYDENKFLHHFKPRLGYVKRGAPFGHPSLFVQSKYLRQMPFKLQYKIIADYDFMIKLIKRDISYVELSQSLANFRTCGISSEVDLSKENFPLHIHHFGLFFAIISFLLTTKQPLIMYTVKVLVSIKHSIKQRKFVWDPE